MTDAAVPEQSPAIPTASLEALDLPKDRVLKLRRLVEELLETNRRFNLTAIREPDEAWVKHILDSLQGLRTGIFDGAARVIDVGAGAGFPGLALATARPDLQVTSLDSTRKKCGFIDAVAEKLEISAVSLCGRAEEAGQDTVYREKFEVAVARAVGSFTEVCELTLPFVRPGGYLVLWRGRQAGEEASASKSALTKLGADGEAVSLLPYTLPGHDMVYHLTVIPKVRPTPVGYPRRVGLPKQRPL